MATYNNQHWLLSHIRNSFISTDDTGMCEAVMLSDDLPKQFLQRERPQKRPDVILGNPRPPEPSTDLISYPGLEQSDDEDMDSASQSFDIQMYPEIGAHRYRSNTAQKLEKMDLARRKAARVKTVKVDDSISQEPERGDLFIRKTINPSQRSTTAGPSSAPVSRLTETLLRCPKQPQNKFLKYAHLDGTSQTGIPTKNLNIFLTMLPEDQRNFPLKICVAANAKIQEVIGFICYKCSILNAEIPLLSVGNYGLYITEEDGEIDLELPPLDVGEPCSKFGFTHLALAERRPSTNVIRVDYRSLSMTSEMEAAGEAAIADVHGGGGVTTSQSEGDMARMLGHNSMIEAPLYRTFRLHILVKGFFKTEVQLGISGERIEIDPVQQKNTKFWTRQKAISFNIESIAYCEIVETKGNKAVIRIWYLNVQPTQPNPTTLYTYPDSPFMQPFSISQGLPAQSTSQSTSLTSAVSASPQHFTVGSSSNHSFKYYDFETDVSTAQQIYDKINFILEVRSSATRREFLIAKEKKRDRQTTKKTFSPFGK